MKIAVIGTGNVGSVLGRRWAEGGHEVTFGTRDPGAERIGDLAADAARDADIVVLATPWGATESVIGQLGDLTDKILIDCTNPLQPDLSLDESAKPSGGEMVAQWATGARVVKAFNTTGSGNMDNPSYGGQRVAMLLCGDDAEANAVVAGLAEELGFEAIDNGGLRQSRYFEALALIWISQAYVKGWGPDFGLSIVRR